MNLINRRKQNKGFTLGELLIVVAIIVVLLAVGIPALFTIQKNLRQTELDAKAETIYTAAQNKLSKMKAAGNTSVLLKSDANGVYALIGGGIPSDADSEADNIKEGDICYFTSADYLANKPAAVNVMDDSTVDESLLNQNWVIEYNPESCIVYAVFYSEERANCAADYTSDYDKYNSKLRYRAERLSDGANVGYYGGGTANSGSKVKEVSPSLTIVNAEKLVAEIKCTKPDGVSDEPVFKVEIEDTAGNKYTAYYVYRYSTPDYLTRIRNVLGTSATIYDGTSDQNNKYYGAIELSGNTYTLNIPLDDLTESASRFVTKYGKVTSADDLDSTKLLCGTPIKVSVTAMCPGNYMVASHSASKITNSLFADDNSTGSSTTTLNTNYGDEENPAVVKYGRHLQNLDEESGLVQSTSAGSEVKPIQYVEQGATIDFSKDNSKASAYNWYETYGSDGYFNGTCSDGMPNFRPITNDTSSLTFTNSHYIIKNLEEEKSTKDSYSDYGLFSKLHASQKVENLIMTGTTVIADGENTNAGAIAGTITGNAAIENSQVYLTTDDIDGKTNKDIWISGTNSAGGLVGTVTGGLVAINNSSASTVIGIYSDSNVSKDASGNITAINQFDTSVAGGLVGSITGGTVSISKSYSDSYLAGTKVGGLVGVGSSDLTIDSSYAAGYMSFTDSTNSAGLVSAAKTISNSYSIMTGLYLKSGVQLKTTTSNCSSMTNVYYRPSDTETLGDNFVSSTDTSVESPVFYNLMNQEIETYNYKVLKDLRHYGDYDDNDEDVLELTFEYGTKSDSDGWSTEVPDTGANSFTIEKSYEAPTGWTLLGWYDSYEKNDDGTPKGNEVVDANGDVVADAGTYDGYTITVSDGKKVLTLSEDKIVYACWADGTGATGTAEIYELTDTFEYNGESTDLPTSLTVDCNEYILASGKSGSVNTIYQDSNSGTKTTLSSAAINVRTDGVWSEKPYIMTQAFADYTTETDYTNNWSRLVWKAIPTRVYYKHNGNTFTGDIKNASTYSIKNDTATDYGSGFNLQNKWSSWYLNYDVTLKDEFVDGKTDVISTLEDSGVSNYDWSFEYRMWRYNGEVLYSRYGDWLRAAYFNLTGDPTNKIDVTPADTSLATALADNPGSTTVYIYQKKTVTKETKYTFNFYTLTYKDGKDTTISSTKFAEGNSVTIDSYPASKTIDGKTYICDGWSKTDGGDIAYTSGTSATFNDDTTLYAHWRNGYTLTLINGNSKIWIGAITGTETSVGTTDNPYTKPSGGTYVLKGWYTAKSTTTGTKVLNADGSVANDDVAGYTVDGKLNLSEDKELYACWTRTYYEKTTSFTDGNEYVLASGQSGTVKIVGISGSSAAYTDATVKTDKVLSQQSYILNVDEAYVWTASKITSDWNTYYTLRDSGYYLGMQVTEDRGRTSVSISVATRTNNSNWNYNSNGYMQNSYTSQNGGGQQRTNYYAYFSNNQLTCSNSSSNNKLFIYQKTEDTTFDGIYTVTYYNYDGSKISSETFKNGTSITLSEYTGTAKTGCEFNGWYDGTNSYEAGASYTVNSNCDFIAQMAAKTFKVTFNKNGGTGTMADETFVYGTAQNLTANAFTKKGYTFTKWNKAADGSGLSIHDKASVTFGATEGFIDEEDVTLYAQWTPNTYTVKFDANGGTGTMTDESFTYDETKALTANSFTRDNYKFLGWSKDKDATTASFTDTAQITFGTTEGFTDAENVTLYAVWKPVYTLTLQSRYIKESTVEKTDYKLSDPVSTIPDYTAPTHEGWRLYGWYDSQYVGSDGKPTGNKVLNADGTVYASAVSGTGYTIEDGNITLTDNVTLYACWVKGNSEEIYVQVNSITDGKDYILASGIEDGEITSLYLNSVTSGNSTQSLTNSTLTVRTDKLYSQDPYIMVSDQTTDVQSNWDKFEWKAQAFTNEEIQKTTYKDSSKTYNGFYLINEWASDNGKGTWYLYNDVVYHNTGKVNSVINSLNTSPSSEGHNFEFRMWSYNYNDRTGESNTNGLIPCYGHDNDIWSQVTYFNGNTIVSSYAKLGETATIPSGYDKVYIYEKQQSESTETYAFDFFTATYDSNGGGTVTPESEELPVYGASGSEVADVTLPLAPTAPTGYDFKSWKNSVSSEEKAAEAETTITTDTTFTAQWKGETVTVTFDANEGSSSKTSEEVTYGSAYGELPTATRTGYTLDGWYTSKEGGDKVESTTVVSNANAHTLYAHWTANTYKVAFDGNGATSGSMSDEDFVYDTANALTENTFERTGYTFSGWNTKADGKGTAYANKASIKNLTSTDKATVTLYAQWTYGLSISKAASSASVTAGENITYTITVKNETSAEVTSLKVTDELDSNLTFDSASDGGTLSDKTVTWSSVSVPANSTTTLTLEVKTADSLTTKTTVNNTAKLTDSDGKESSSLTVPVTVNPQTFTVSYAFKGVAPSGSDAPGTDTVTYGTEYTATQPEAVSGWTFGGWFTDEELTSPYVDKTIITENKSLHGQWTYGLSIEKSVVGESTVEAGSEVTYKITVTNSTLAEVSGLTVTDELDSNLTFDSASDGGTLSDKTVTWSNVTVPASGSKELTLTVKTNSKLKETTTVKNKAVLKDTKAKTTESEEASVEVTPKKLTVKYEYQNTPTGKETPPASAQIDYGTAYTATMPDKVSGWTFDGWYTDSKLTDKFTDGTEITDNTTLRGKWTYGLSISKAASSATVTAGENITYTITVTNDTDTAVAGLTVTDVLDSILSVSSAEGASWTDQTVTWSNVAIPANGTRVLTLEVETDSTIIEAKDVENKATLKDAAGKETASPGVHVMVNPQKFTVSYVFKDAPTVAKVPDSDTVTYGTEYSAKGPDAVSGWTFDGWYTDESLTEKFVDKTPVVGKTILHGTWTYGLSIEKTVVGESTVEAGSEVTYKITVTNSTLADVSEITVTDELNSNLTFDSASDDGTLSDKTVTWSNVTVPASGSKELTLTVKTSGTVESDTTVKNTAEFTDKNGDGDKSDAVSVTINPKKFTVSYTYPGTEGTDYPKDAVAPTDTNEYTYGTTYTAEQPDAVSGWIFDGWYTNESLTNKYTDGTKITKNTTLYGKWEYGLSISKAASSASVTAGDNITYTITVKNDTSAAVTSLKVTDNVDSGLTVVKAEDAEISGQIVTWSNVSVSANSSTTLTLKVKTADNLTDQTTVENAAKLTDSKSKTVESNTVSTTINPQEFTVSYQFVGTAPSGVNPPGTDTVTYGTEYTATQPGTVGGWIFDGWYTDSDLTNKYTDGTEIIKNTTLHGKWSEVLTLTLHYDGGTYSYQGAPLTSGTSLAGKVDNYQTPTRTGWTFVGWSTANSGSGSLVSDANGKLTANLGSGTVNLYACWKQTAYQKISSMSSDFNSSNSYLIGAPSDGKLYIIYGVSKNSQTGNDSFDYTSSDEYVTAIDSTSTVDGLILLGGALDGDTYNNYKWQAGSKTSLIKNIGLDQLLNRPSNGKSGYVSLGTSTSYTWSMGSSTLAQADEIYYEYLTKWFNINPKTSRIDYDATIFGINNGCNCYIYKEVTAYDWSN